MRQLVISTGVRQARPTRTWLGRCAAAALALLLLAGLGCGSADARPSGPLAGSPAAGAYNYLDGVSCAAPTYCMAVGIHVSPNGNYYESISELWKGRRWVTKQTVHPAPRNTYLYGVSCPAVDACYAVGTYDTGADGHTAALVEFWNGEVWQVQATPDPAGGNPYTELHSVSCSSPVACVATGAHSVNMGQTFADHAITEWWNGRRWTLHGVSHPARSFDGLYSVSCPDAGDCQAVGNTQALPYSEPSTPFAEGLSASKWSIEPVPSPAGQQSTPTGTLYSVSCAAANACEAVGGYDADTSGASQTSWAAQWNGTAWATQPTVQPSAGDDDLVAVSCPPAQVVTDCEAVGNSATGMFAELWNGNAWTSQPFPSPDGSTGVVEAVSCASATDCEAVGASGYGTLAELWDGSQWTVQTPMDPTA